jgi:hypothetical protein
MLHRFVRYSDSVLHPQVGNIRVLRKSRVEQALLSEIVFLIVGVLACVRANEPVCEKVSRRTCIPAVVTNHGLPLLWTLK